MNEFDVNPLQFAYEKLGILKFENSEISGESHVIKVILPRLLLNPIGFPLIFFDIGANTGQFSSELNEVFPNAHIYSFEPNQHAFKKLKTLFINYPQIRPYEIGFDIAKRNSKIYTYSDALDSAHATIYGNILADIHKRKDTVSIDIRLERIDDFSRENGIDHIHFMKIDTEGNEFQILKSAESLMNNDSIDVIQFEFNEMNVITRVFFKDFYDLLSDKYSMYRLDTETLIPLKHYNTYWEIFKYQNILAIHHTLNDRL